MSAQQRSLVNLMREHQFGRIENISIRAGEPILDQDVKVVRVTRFSGKGDMPKIAITAEFELKKQVRDLFDEFARLQNGTVVRLEFRHRLPFLLETATPTTVPDLCRYRLPEPGVHFTHRLLFLLARAMNRHARTPRRKGRFT